MDVCWVILRGQKMYSYTSCTLTTLHCSKVTLLQCCHMKRYNKIFTKMWGVYLLLLDTVSCMILLIPYHFCPILQYFYSISYDSIPIQYDYSPYHMIIFYAIWFSHIQYDSIEYNSIPSHSIWFYHVSCHSFPSHPMIHIHFIWFYLILHDSIAFHVIH